MKRVISVRVPDAYDGRKINDLLRRNYGVSGTLIRRMKEYDDGILLDGSPAKTTATVHSGDVVSFTVGFDDEKGDIALSDAPFGVIYEDDDILVCDKPARMPTHPGNGHYDDSLGSAVAGYYAKMGKNFVFRPVNRLDSHTSGLCVIAKHAYAHDRLKKSLHTADFERYYLALVEGEISHSGAVDAPISRCDDSVIKRRVDDNGDYALTSYTPVQKCGENTLVRLRLHTGRTHQIRVHMAYIGHPLVDDFLYGDERGIIGRCALHSAEIGLCHPVTGERMKFTSPIPDDMKKTL